MSLYKPANFFIIKLQMFCRHPLGKSFGPDTPRKRVCVYSPRIQFVVYKYAIIAMIKYLKDKPNIFYAVMNTRNWFSAGMKVLSIYSMLHYWISPSVEICIWPTSNEQDFLVIEISRRVLLHKHLSPNHDCLFHKRLVYLPSRRYSASLYDY